MKRAAIALFALAASCGGSDPAESTPSDDAIASDTLTSSDANVDDTLVASDSSPPPADVSSDGAVFGPYPAGPYGNKLNDVVANLAWEGNVSPLADALATTKPYVTTSMDLLRRDAKKGYALVHVSEFY